MSDVTHILARIESGDPIAADQLLPLVYDELRKLAAARMAHERPDHSLDATGLVHEAYLRLLGDQQFESRGHFFAAAAEAMRRILVNQARDRNRQKRCGGRVRLELLFEETLKLMKAKLGPEHPNTLATMNNLATAYWDAKKRDLALPLYEETLKLRQAKLGSEHPDTLISMRGLAEVYKAAGKPDLTLPLYEEMLKLRKAKLGPEHSSTITSMANLVEAYNDANQGEKAAETLREFIDGQGQRANPDDPRFALGLAQGSFALLKCRQYAASEEMLRNCLAIREKTQPDDWRTFNTQSMLGEALLGQKKYAESEPLLLAGYEGLEQRE